MTELQSHYARDHANLDYQQDQIEKSLRLTNRCHEIGRKIKNGEDGSELTKELIFIWSELRE